MASIFNTLCGESGLVNQITDAQNEIRIAVTSGKNAINAVKNFVNEVETLSDAIKNNPEVVKRKLQEDIANILSREALANPAGAVSQLLAVRAAYQEAGPAIDRIVENVEQFVKDPLNTPLSLCEDIPNIVKVGEEVKELATPAIIPAGPPPAGVREPFIKEVGISEIETIPRFPPLDIAFAVEAAGRYSGPLTPGAANEAAGAL